MIDNDSRCTKAKQKNKNDIHISLFTVILFSVYRFVYQLIMC